MAKKIRSTIPRKTQDRILAEYRHRCAICGAAQPQLHHIDRDPSNHEDWNLLPLCPNCHLSDQHNPTSPVDPMKVRLFRVHKDPTILHPKFHPLWRRMRFLVDLPSSPRMTELRINSQELLSFVAALKMGTFYAAELGKLVGVPVKVGAVSLDATEAQMVEWDRRDGEKYKAKIEANRDKAISLLIELLRFQDWNPGDCRLSS